MWIYIKKYGLNFQDYSRQFSFTFFSFFLSYFFYYKSLNIRTGAIMKNSKILKFVPHHLKTKKICNYAVKNLSYLLRYVPDWYKTQPNVW